MDPELIARMFGPEALLGMSMAAPPSVAPVPVIAPPPAVATAPAVTSGSPMMMGPSEAYRSEPMGVPQGAAPTSLGAALEPSNVPLPQPRPANAPGATPVAGDNSLLNTLKGVKMPEAPVTQKVTTPHAPQVAKLQAGHLADLLASLGIGPQQALPGLKLPSTLGQALGGR